LKPILDVDRYDRLAALHEVLSAIRYGHTGWRGRVDELGPGFPGRGMGAGSKGTHSSPTENAMDRSDPAAQVLLDFDRALVKLERASNELWELHQRHTMPQHAVARMSDPGCWSCARVEGAWSATFASTEVETLDGKRKTTIKRPLCWWCYRFLVPSGQGRLPTYHEVAIHVGGGRVLVSR